MEENEVVKKTENKQDEQREENNLNGVDLAKNEKTKEKEEKEQIQEKSKLDEIILQQTADITLGEIKNIMDTLDIVGMGEGQAKLMLGNAVIGIVQNGKIEYTRNARTAETEEILKKLNEEIEEQQKAEQEQKERDTGEREEEKKPETIKDDNEKKPEQEETAVHESEEIKRDSSWIEIRSDREIDEMRTFIGAIQKEHPEISNINRTFIAPDKNNSNSYRLYVQGKNKKYKEVPLEMTEGVNPMHEQVTTTENDGTNSTKKTPIQMLKINNRSMIMIFNGGRTNTEVHIGLRTDGDNYKSTKISSAKSQNVLNDPNEDVKEQVSSTKSAQVEGDRQERAYAVMINLEKQDVPKEIDPSKDGKGIEAKEMENHPTALISNLKDGLKEMLYKRNISLSNEAIDKIAESIVDGKDFKDAIEEGTRVDEEAGRIPPDSAERKADDIYNSITKDEEMETERDDDEGPNHHIGY